MKRILVVFSLLILSSVAHAQLNNSWIDYSKTYYKFKLAQNGVYRINESVLSSVGLGSVPAEQFQLWRNGKQVRIYTSVASGPLGGSDYIEFWGEMNDGKADKTLYRDSTYQLNDHYSLSSDSAAYFLTVNPAGGNAVYTTTANNTGSNVLPAEPYFMQKIESPFRDIQNGGFYVDLGGDYIYSSEYDKGEGWTSSVIAGCCLNKTYAGLNTYTSGPTNNVSFTITASGVDTAIREFQVKLFSTVIIDTVFRDFNIINKTVNNIALSTLENADNASVFIGFINSNNSSDNIVIGTFSFTYPATFNFNGQKDFYFELPSAPAGNYLVINNFNNNGVAPVLYDKNTGNRYVGDITTPGQIKFELPPSMDPLRKFLLVSEDPSNIAAINTLTSRTFINYGAVANQGNYLIISNPVLYNDGHGNNNVDNYRQYRASVAGGSYNAKVISIDEITDQFAFGIRKHPVAVRDFIRYAYNNFAVKPQYIFIIGGGVNAVSVAENQTSPLEDQLNLVPTFGYPASDVFLACNPTQNVPLVPIGRLSAVTGTEVGYYLQKMIEYEGAQASTTQTFDNKAWMKNFIHLSGGNDASDNSIFTLYLNGYKNIAQDTLLGANVQTFVKSSTSSVQQVNGGAITQIINNGTAFIGYFGHASGTTLAYNLGAPQSYQNQGKYYFFNVSGCIAGDNYELDNNRLAGYTTLSEEYVSANERGSIGFLGGTYLGISNFLDNYNRLFYQEFSNNMYGNTVGNQLQAVCQQTILNTPNPTDYSQNSFLTRCNLGEVNLNGDPALRINTASLPDFDIEDQLVKISPSILSVADNNFTVAVKWVNLGRATNDSMRVLVERKLPNNTIQILYNQVIPATKYSDSVSLIVPINHLTDKGTNQIIVVLDADNKITESSETNNTITKSFEIFATELQPIFPYDYAIVNQQNVTYSASTANPLSGQNKYLMQVDTSMLFNSPFEKQYTSSGIGGVIQFTPNNILFTDSTVYYWRTAIAPTNNTDPIIWNTYSFVYLPTGGTGFNQSHYYQHLQSTYSNMSLSSNGVFVFPQKNSTLTIKTGIYPATNFDNISVTLDGTQLDYYGCVYQSLQFYVYDSATLQPILNYNVSASNGRFMSQMLCNTPSRDFFEFYYPDPAARKNAINFLDSIPGGDYVSVTNLGTTANTSFISDWQSDQATLGAGNDLYHKLKALGFTQIDSFTQNIPFLFFYQKNVSSFAPQQFVGTNSSSRISQNIPLLSRLDSGSILSPLFGPAKNWTSLHWRGKSIDLTLADQEQIQVYGIKADGSQNLLATVSPATDTSLSYISAVTYPYLQLKMLNSDSVYATPNQLQYWRINADYVPEGAIAPNILYSMQDTVGFGQKIPVAVAFKNVSQVAFDSVQVSFVITDANNVTHIIPIPKGKILVSGDTLSIRDTLDSKLYPGNNTLYVMFNPNNDQPEQYLFNNFLYANFFVKVDNTNPLLDVTFDGVHILNKDIVSAKPNILIKLTDENMYIPLSDTGSITVQVQYPDQTIHNYPFGDSLRFIPANLSTGNNVASVEFLPSFNPPNGEGVYTLIVTGKDASGNAAGNLSYRVSFTVINKEMISNLLNYPNPFTTSTAFVFTITGSQIPQNMRIQILTITGKVVKEITQSELGPIHVGTNITQYKWDGTDRYGQKLANGVYLYRVLTNLNGKSLDKYNGEVPDGSGKEATITDGLSNTDQYFTKGYGKMYLMR